jgi:hypothetical protein
MDPEEQQQQQSQSAPATTNDAPAESTPQPSGAEASETSEAAAAMNTQAIDAQAIDTQAAVNAQQPGNGGDGGDGGGSWLDKGVAWAKGVLGVGGSDDGSAAQDGNAQDGGAKKDMTPEEVQKMQADMLKQAQHMDGMMALTGKLDVVDKIDPSKPNQVTLDEYNRLAEQYASIKRGDTDVQFDTSGMKPEDAAKFKNGAMTDIASMMQTQSGREMLDGVTDNVSPMTGEHHTVTISNTNNPQNADTAGPAGQDKQEHDGTGVDSQIQYKPGEDFFLRNQNVKETSNSALFHEMAHAYSMGRGEVAEGDVDNPQCANDKGVKAAEYQVVGLGGYDIPSSTPTTVPLTENQYRKERRAVGDQNLDDRETYNADPEREFQKQLQKNVQQ